MIKLGTSVLCARRTSLRLRPAATVALAFMLSASGSARGAPDTFEGKSVRIGNGAAHTVVRVGSDGQPMQVGVIFTPTMLKGLPKAVHDMDPNFPFQLPMPTRGPKTVFDHVVINWESTGHPPAHVFDIPHFDFHFYLVTPAQRKRVFFRSENDSGDPSQQPAAKLLPAGYIVPPGTAVAQMGVHAIDPAGPEFHDQPFTATFIYGYHNKQQTFMEPMVSKAFLESKPSFAAPIKRPSAFSKTGLYPSAYRVRYDESRKRYEVMLEEFR